MRYILIAVLLSLTACATPVTVLKKDNTVATCGGGTVGSIFGGVIGYNIQKRHDLDCIKEHADYGYKIMETHH